jgi:hypothetical protein
MKRIPLKFDSNGQPLRRCPSARNGSWKKTIRRRIGKGGLDLRAPNATAKTGIKEDAADIQFSTVLNAISICHSRLFPVGLGAAPVGDA